MNPLYILLAIPFFLLLMGLEVGVGWARKQSWYRLNDAIVNLCIGIGNQAFNLFFKAMLLGAYIWVYEQAAFIEQPATWWSFLLALIGFDFFFYWAHRWSHEINFFWGAHVVHHSSEEYNLSVALRQSWWHNVIAFFIFLPLPLLGFEPMVFFLAAGVHTLYQFWIHTKAIGKLHPVIEFIFNTPSHHRVHHGRNPKYIDKNHAGVFILFDRIFGTFQVEEEEPTYGITTPIKSWNPLWANVHYYAEMFQKARRMRRWQDKIRMLWARPGWLPEDMGGFEEVPEIEAQDTEVYDRQTTKPFRRYAVVQFALLLMGLVALMVFFEELSWGFRFAFGGIIILSTVICGAILENKRWVIYAEYARLLAVLGTLNALYYTQYVEWFLTMLVGSGVVYVLMNLWFTLNWVRRPRLSQVS